MNGYFIDDLGNTKPDFIEKSPCEKLIDIMNNMPTYANMAEVEMKGKVSIEPKAVVGTSNVKLADLARKFSMLPFSIVRRMNVHLEIRVKKEFWKSDVDQTLDSSKVFATYGEGSTIQDIWEIDVFVPLESKKGDMLECIDSNVGIEWVIRFVTSKVRAHFAHQRMIINHSSNLGKRLDFCPSCKLPRALCQCNEDDSVVDALEALKADIPFEYSDDDSDMDQQADWDDFDDGVPELSAERDFVRVAENNFPAEPLDQLTDDDDPLFDVMKERVTSAAVEVRERTYTPCVEYLESLDNRNWNWLNYVPDFVFNSRIFQWGFLLRRKEDFLMYEQNVRRVFVFWLLFVCLFPFGGCSFAANSFMFATLFPSFLIYASLLYYWKLKCERELARSRDFTPELFRRLRNLDARYMCGASVSIAALYFLIRAYRSSKFVTQGNLAPTSMKDVEERDAQENPWATPVVDELKVSTKSKTTPPAHLARRVVKQLCHVLITEKDRSVDCDAFFVRSNIAILPAHILRGKKECKALFTRCCATNNGATFRSPISCDTTVMIPGTDLCLTYVPNSGDYGDLTGHLPDGLLPDAEGMLYHRDSRGGIASSRLFARSKRVTTSAARFDGHEYSLTFPTFQGLCTSVVLLNYGKFSVIGGFHLGGNDGKNSGCCGTLLQSKLLPAIEELLKVPGVLLAMNSGDMPTEKYDVNFYESADIHPRSPVNFLPVGNNLQYFGQVQGRVSYTKSDVVPTVITDLVHEETGVERQHGPPQFHRWKNWQASLEHSSTPSPGIEGSLVARAVKDYEEPLIALITDPKLPWKHEVRPLTEMETICGRDGRRFVDKMKPTTSVGFPLSGAKKRHLTYLDPEEFPDFQCPAELDPKFWEEACSMEERYLQGERAYPIFKACLKDEPTKLTKEKVRVFQASEIAFQLLVRKYFLPVARFLSMNPLVSECAVGVNCLGPEWKDLMDHVDQFGKDRILAGDYSKYDLRMPAQITLAAFSVYIDLAEATGNYSERDLTIMRGIATDNVYPVSAYNGDLLMLTGTVPSGTNLTVYINNTGNSIFHRAAFFDIVEKEGMQAPSYRSAVASTFYGDDAKSSVKEGYECFNHIAYANWLKVRDIVFTMPDKESEPTEYMQSDDVDFLKRKNVFMEDLGVPIGALDEDSIFKMLHTVLASKAISPRQQAAENIDTALREWFAHGREKYELRRSQMRRVAERADLMHMTREIDMSFDDRISRYKEKYLKPSSDPSDE